MWSAMLFLCFVLFVFPDKDSKHMEREALNRRNAWEPSAFYSLGKETFYFTGQEISIRESLDSYGAVIWPGVRNFVCNFIGIV